MKGLDGEESRELKVLDRYLSLQADDLFEDVASTVARLPDAADGGRTSYRPAAGVALFVAGAAFVLAIFGQAGTGLVEVASLRGAPAQLEGASEWRGDASLELAWSSVSQATHYSLQVWDLSGGLVASRIVEEPGTTAAVEVRPDATRPLLWTVVAWDGTRRLAASEVLISPRER